MTAQPAHDDDGHPIVPVIRWANVAGVPPTMDTALLDAWAAETIPKLAAVFSDMAEALQPLAETMAKLEAVRHVPVHTGRLRTSVPPFWTVQPNRSRRR